MFINGADENQNIPYTQFCHPKVCVFATWSAICHDRENVLFLHVESLLYYSVITHLMVPLLWQLLQPITSLHKGPIMKIFSICHGIGFSVFIALFMNVH